MNTESLEKWEPVAWALHEPLETLPVPSHVFFGEATDVLKFTRVYWHGPDGQPGLSSAVSGTGRLRESVSQELLELIDAHQTAQTQHRLTTAMPGVLIADRARTTVGVFRDTLGWYFTDAQDVMGQARLDKLDRLHDDAYSHDALASALFDYAGLAEMYADRIQGVLGFDRAQIDTARQLGRDLRARSGAQEFPDPRQDPRRMQELQMRIATLIYERMQMVRAAARVVFKNEPDILKLVTSDYLRAKQAAYRRRAEQAEAEAASPEADSGADAKQPTPESDAVAPTADTPKPPVTGEETKEADTEAA